MVVCVCEQCENPVGTTCGDAAKLKLGPEDEQKLKWANQAIERGWGGEAADPSLSPNISKVLQWLVAASSKERMEFREAMVSKLERTDASQRISGMLEQWYAGVNPEVRKVRARLLVFLMLRS